MTIIVGIMGGNSLDKYNGLWVVNLVAFEMGLTLRFFLPRQQGVGVGTTLCKVVMISDVRYLCDSNVDVSLRKHNNVRWSTGSQGVWSTMGFSKDSHHIDFWSRHSP